MPSVINHGALKARSDIPSWLTLCGYRRLAEIGVRSGNGLKLLVIADPTLLIGVDLWTDQGTRAQNDAPISQKRLDAMHQELVDRGRDFWPFLKIIRKHSVEAAKDVEDGSLDFVFIDADHTFEAVTADIAAWWPKVRVGGTLAGHDFVERTMDNGVSYGVIRAVCDFAERLGLQGPIHHTAGEKFPSWFVTKTESMR